MERYTAALNLPCALELSQARVADSGVAQRRGVNREGFEILEREHALESRQRLIPTGANDAAHSKVVEGPGLLKAVASGRGAGCHRIEPRFRLGPSPETHPELAIEPGHVELNVARVGGKAASHFERVERALEPAFAALNQRSEKLLPRPKRVERRAGRQRRRDERRGLGGIMLEEGNFTTQKPEGPAPCGLGRGLRDAAVGERLGRRQLAAPYREPRLVKERGKLPLAVSRAAAEHRPGNAGRNGQCEE